jgi:hypothetical protein
VEETLIISYSPVYKAYLRHNREGSIERARKIVDKPGKLDHKRQGSPSRFAKEQRVTQDGEVVAKRKLTLDEEAISTEERFDGFYCVCTNLDEPIETIIKINKGRWEIEESFRFARGRYIFAMRIGSRRTF